MEPIDELHALTTLYLEWLDNEISKLKKTVANWELDDWSNDDRESYLSMRVQTRRPHHS